MGVNWKNVNSSAGRAGRRDNSPELPPKPVIVQQGYYPVGATVVSVVFGNGTVESSTQGPQGHTVAVFNGEPRKIRNSFLRLVG